MSGVGTPVGALVADDLLCVQREMTLDALGKVMLDRDATSVPVVDEAERAVGIVAFSDIVRGMQVCDEYSELARRLEDDSAPGTKLRQHSLVVADVMRLPPPEVLESSGVGEAIATLHRHRAQRLLVVAADRRVVGVVTAAELLRFVVAQPPSVPLIAPSLGDGLTPKSEVVACHLSDAGVILGVTDGLLSLLGRSRSLLVGASFAELVDVRDRGRTISGTHFALRMTRSDGVPIDVEWVASAGSNATRLIIGHDVTAALRTRARLEAELAVALAVERAHTPAEAARRALALLARSEGWKWAALFWVDAAEQRLALRATWPFEGESATPEPGLATRARKRGAPLWMLDRPKHGMASRGECAVPLHHRGDVVGVIEIGGQTGPIDTELQLLFDGVARTLAMAGPRVERPSSTLDPRAVEAERLATLGSLAGGVAHQINNALTWVRLSLGRVLSFELSRAPHTPTRAHRIELLGDVREGFLRVETVARQLAAFSRIDDDEIQAVDLGEVIEGATRVMANDVRHRARLVSNLGALPAVRGSHAALRQVVLNVLQNAAHAIEEGAAAENEIRVNARVEGKDVVLEVADTGVGIPEERLPQIFEPFYTTKSEGSGIGLGLSLARGVIERFGGRIGATSSPGRGTTIRIQLPVADGPLPTTPTTDDAPPSTPRRVLVIDDDRPVADAVALELEGHQVTVVGSGREALSRIRDGEIYDVILCDLMMPEMTGMELFETIAREAPAVAERFVFMTGGAFTPKAQRFLREVKNARIQKPFHATALQALVRGLVAPP